MDFYYVLQGFNGFKEVLVWVLGGLGGFFWF